MPDVTGPNARRGAAEELRAVIEGQHARIRELFSTAVSVPAQERGTVFVELVRFLAIHEAAEQEALHVARHPAADSEMGTTTAASSAAEISAQRLREEDSAAGVLERLEAMDPTTGSFHVQLEQVQEAVSHHASAEERQEVPAFLAEASSGELDRVVAVLRQVEQLAADSGDSPAVPRGASFAVQCAGARRILRDEQAG